MTTITVRDFLEQLACASPDARMVFKIECEDKNFDARLEFSRVTCLSPATEVVVTMADNTEDVRTELALSEEESFNKGSALRILKSDVKSVIEDADAEKWGRDQILKELKDLL